MVKYAKWLALLGDWAYNLALRLNTGINIARRDWSRGVDLALFHPSRRAELDLPRPVFAFVGRLAVEKNIAAFLALDLPGSKMVIGSGPQAEDLKRRFPETFFMGAQHGAALARLVASADVFVFPSRTDTFGLALLEAIARGVPVAAYPVPGPIDGVADAKAGVLDRDLRAAALKALTLKGADARAYAERFTWRRTAEQFLSFLEQISFSPHGSRCGEKP